MIDMLRLSSILPFAEYITTSHPQNFKKFFVTALGVTLKNQIKSTYKVNSKKIS